jgi:hypothetical protein
MWRSITRGLVMALVISVQVQGLPVRAGSAGAVLSGTILRGNQHQPVSGAKLLVGDSSSGRIFASSATGSDGRFTVRNLPASTYELAIQSGGGLYPTGVPVQLASGAKQEIQLAFADPSGPTSDSVQLERAGVWSNPLTATMVVLGGAVVVGLALEGATDDSSSGSASPTGP